jgi:hypothetical protein
LHKANIPLLSLQLGAIEAQWFGHQPESEAQDRGDSPTLTAVGRHWDPVILTLAKIGSLEPGRFLYSHKVGCHWGPWFWLRPGLEAWEQGDSPTLTVVGCHWSPVILTSARIGSPGLGRFPYSHCGWAPMRPSDSDFSQNWEPETGEIPLLSLWLGAIETQWFRLWLKLEAWNRGDSSTLTAVGAIEAQWLQLQPELEA